MVRSKKGVRRDSDGIPESRRGEDGLGSWTGLGFWYFPGCWDPERRLVDRLVVQAPAADY